MQWLLLIALAGAGASLRYLISSSMNGSLPWGTLSVNVLGSLLVGWIYANQGLGWPVYVKTAVIVGFLGALTTFSSYSLEILSLLEKGRLNQALFYFFLSQTLAIGACFLGMRFARF